MWRGVAVAGVLLGGGCYSPTPPAGAPCPDGVCPTGLVCSPATQTCEHNSIFADARLPDGPMADTQRPIDAAPPPAFLYRRRISIKNVSTATMPAGYTVYLPLGTLLTTLTSQGKVRSDYADLRIMGDVALERDRTLDTGPLTGSAINFALATALAPNQTTTDFALYYGAPNASPAPANGAAVFQVYDDFTTSIASFWLKNDTASVSGGKLILHPNHIDGITTNASTDKITPISGFEIMASTSDPQSDPTVQPEGTLYYWWGYQHTGDFSASDPWAVFIARGKGQIHGEQKSPVGCEAGCDGTYVAQDSAQHYYVIVRDPTQSLYYKDGTLTSTIPVTNSEDYSLIIRNFTATSTVSVDWVRARARVSPDPLVSMGAEENL